MPSYILPLLKSPNPRGRLGPPTWQDWYRTCVLAATLSKKTNSTTLVVSGFVESLFDEAAHYAATLRNLGTEPHIIREGVETITQIQAALRALRRGDELIIIASLPHWPRVWWLTRSDEQVRRRAVIGIPRPRELVTDLILAVAFPFIDLMGWREWWIKRTTARREDGSL